MDTFMRGLPHRYRDVQAEENTVVKIVIDTEIGGEWFLIRNYNPPWQFNNICY